MILNHSKTLLQRILSYYKQHTMKQKHHKEKQLLHNDEDFSNELWNQTQPTQSTPTEIWKPLLKHQFLHWKELVQGTREAYQDLVLSEKEHLKESYLEQALWRIVDSIEWSERIWDKLQWVKMFMDVMWMVNKEAIIIEKKSLPTIEYKKWNKSLWL